MKRLWVVLVAAAVLALAAIPAPAQPVAAAKSGMVSYIEGAVYVDGKAISDPIIAEFPFIKEGGTLRTLEGRAEVNMNPGIYVRLGENSELHMVTNRFIDTRAELMKGSAVVQVVEVIKDNNFTLVLNNAEVSISKSGDYRFDVQPARLKVFAGQAQVKIGNGPDAQTLEVGSGKMVNLGGEQASVEKFDKDATDALDRWSARRGELAAQANLSSAKQTYDVYGSRDPCYGYNNYAVPVGTNPCVGTWRWNPWYGLWTYIPINGRLCDPYWGYCYYNPRNVAGIYYPPVWRPAPTSGFGNPGYGISAPTSGGYSGSSAAASTAMSSPSAGTGSSAAASSAASSAGASSSGGGGRGR